MQGWKILIEGRIQGVGFRPFIYRTAQKLNIKGTVRNTTGGVEITINADDQTCNEFIEEIREEKPSIAVIRKIESYATGTHNLDSFHILESNRDNPPTLELTPDFAMCDLCARDIDRSSGRRHNYAFTTCTYCGPRYSIIERLPYDRERTTMADFKMCPDCITEYQHPKDRRFHSQTNSCPQCKISLEMHHRQAGTIQKITHDDPIHKAVSMWKEGKILAIKGLSGYLITCDPSLEDTVSRLRQIKQRPSKPFAVMCPDSNYIVENFNLTEHQKKALLSETAPIVLLTPKNHTDWNMDGIAPGLSKIGVMIPYTPLFKLLLDKFKQPIIATSGNITNAPITYEDNAAIADLGPLADVLLLYNRRIIMPQDDSVVQYTPFENRRIILRRSRGLAPSLATNFGGTESDKVICAMGGDLKSSFGFLNQGKIYISQYLGDLSHYDTQERYQMAMDHFFTLFKKNPEVILADRHPGYHSTGIGKELSSKFDIPFHAFQHHKAHFGAVLAENDLLLIKEPVLGVCWDGTGFGDDGHIWGGEFFLKSENKLTRKGHLNYFNHLAGDKMAAEPRLSAFSVIHNSQANADFLQPKFTEVEWNNYSRLIKSDELLTSSVGRLFDAIASIIGVCDKNNFESQAAMLLEEFATRFAMKSGLNHGKSYEITIDSSNQCNVRGIIHGIRADMTKRIPPEELAYKFHLSMVKMIELMAERTEVKNIAFSGGVFQNALLNDMIIHQLNKKYNLYFHQQLSPNDENIAFGQLHLYLQAID